MLYRASHFFQEKCEYKRFVTTVKTWPHRLTVRTSGSHPENPGSIPGEVTMKTAQLLLGFFHG